MYFYSIKMNKDSFKKIFNTENLNAMIYASLSLIFNSLLFDIVPNQIIKQFVNPLMDPSHSWLTFFSILLTILVVLLIVADFVLLESIKSSTTFLKSTNSRKKTTRFNQMESKGVKTSENTTNADLKLITKYLLMCTSALNIFYLGILFNKYTYYYYGFFTGGPFNTRIAASSNVSKTDYLDQYNNEFYNYLYGDDYAFNWYKYINLIIDIAFSLGLFVLVFLYHIFSRDE